MKLYLKNIIVRRDVMIVHPVSVIQLSIKFSCMNPLPNKSSSDAEKKTKLSPNDLQGPATLEPRYRALHLYR